MSNIYDIGDSVRLSATFTSAGVVADPTTVTFRLEDSLGNVTTYVYGIDSQLVKDSTGVYHVDIALTRSGNYHYRFNGAGAVIAASEVRFEVNRSAIITG